MNPKEAKIEALRILSEEARRYCDNWCGEWGKDEGDVYRAVRTLGRKLGAQANKLSEGNSP